MHDRTNHKQRRGKSDTPSARRTRRWRRQQSATRGSNLPDPISICDLPLAKSMELVIADKMAGLVNDKRFKDFHSNLLLECKLSPRQLWLKLIGYVAARMLEETFGGK